jgi:flagellar secretion chaperone FliS
MSYYAKDAYLESRILSADAVELTRLLFQACMDSVRTARRHLKSGEIRERSNAISKACEILFELSRSLDFERGGQISQRLGLLYDYMQRRLIDANCQQADAPLAEVLGLLATLAEGWDGIRAERQESISSTPAASANHVWLTEPAVAGCSAGGWSF